MTELRSAARVRRFLDDSMYALVDHRLSLEVPVGPNGFPPFDRLRAAVERLDPDLATLFRLLRLGEAVAADDVGRAVPEAVLDDLVACGLLEHEDGTWHTPSLLLVPLHGLVVAVGTPASYPTARRPPAVWFDLSSYVVAASLPGSLAGLRVLEVCAGSGVQALLAARRGAASVTALEIDGEAVATARLNAELNRVEPAPDVRCSDGLAALDDGERFDFVVCNTPYAPVLPEDRPPADVGEVGNAVLFRVLEELPRHLADGARGVLAAWRSVGDGRSSAQTERVAAALAAAGCATTAFLDRAPDRLDGVVDILRGDAASRWGEERGRELADHARQLLEGADADRRGFYNQLIFFDRALAPTTRVHGLRPPGGAGGTPTDE